MALSTLSIPRKMMMSGILHLSVNIVHLLKLMQVNKMVKHSTITMKYAATALTIVRALMPALKHSPGLPNCKWRDMWRGYSCVGGQNTFLDILWAEFHMSWAKENSTLQGLEILLVLQLPFQLARLLMKVFIYYFFFRERREEGTFSLDLLFFLFCFECCGVFGFPLPMCSDNPKEREVILFFIPFPWGDRERGGEKKERLRCKLAR